MAIWGYQWSENKITTEDGYILTTYRIIGDDQGNVFSSSKPPVVVMHGMTMDAGVWLEAQGHNSNGVKPFQLMLADAGYDVYLASNRGTKLSREHI